MVEEHVSRTGSTLGFEMLSAGKSIVSRFWQVCPKEMLQRLSHPLNDRPEDSVAAQ